MRLLVVDGNSIMNRAFYGIKVLTTKSGIYTNAVYGFLNILLRLKEMSQAEAIAVAFDLHAPTFRHKMFADYKAGRHTMPDELRSQMPMIKEILKSLGIKTLECEGWEADDILGTLAQKCRENGDLCFIATGDRDSLQLAHGGVTVLLAHTKAGRAITDPYDEAAIEAEYGVTPQELIQVKALQGDSSDNIPGVAGVGAKTALSLIHDYHNIDYIYEHLDELEIKPGVREKLRRDKEKAYLSLDLGTIRTNAPVDTNAADYVPAEKVRMRQGFCKYELFSLMDKFELNINDAHAPEPEKVNRSIIKKEADYSSLEFGGKAYFYCAVADNEITEFYFANGDEITAVHSFDEGYAEFIKSFFESDVEKYSYNTKYLHRLAASLGTACKNVRGDLMLSAYLLRPSDSNYEISHLCAEYGVSVPEYKNELGSADENVVNAAVLADLFAKRMKSLKKRIKRNFLKISNCRLRAFSAKWKSRALRWIKRV